MTQCTRNAYIRLRNEWSSCSFEIFLLLFVILSPQPPESCLLLTNRNWFLILFMSDTIISLCQLSRVPRRLSLSRNMLSILPLLRLSNFDFYSSSSCNCIGMALWLPLGSLSLAFRLQLPKSTPWKITKSQLCLFFWVRFFVCSQADDHRRGFSAHFPVIALSNSDQNC